MAVIDHLGITVNDLGRGIAQFDPILDALGFEREDADGSVSWWREGDPQLILFPVREGAEGEVGTAPHVHGSVGWQHLALAVDSRAEVERLHAIALDAGWTEVRAPTVYPRFNDRYFASFIEDDSGIRLEFMHNPPALP